MVILQIILKFDGIAHVLRFLILIAVINVTLPDEKQNYLHRIGRVGRADR